jgi:hypothetical protein
MHRSKQLDAIAGKFDAANVMLRGMLVCFCSFVRLGTQIGGKLPRGDVP